MGEKVIIGVDKGHGENTAFVYRLDSGKNAEPLSLTQDRTKVIPSAIAYREDGTVLIGDNAARTDGVICYFKTAPQSWRDSHGNPRKINGYSVQDLMADEIRSLYQMILKYNDNDVLHADDEIFLYVGCPSATTWTDQEWQNAYQNLICWATGLDQNHVTIVAESRAAIFNSFMSNREGIQANEGVAVLDFGSSTADFTYICTGEIMMERSWTLGAAEIEHGMLLHLLNQNGMTMEDIYRGNLSNLYLRLRKFKEQYYSGDLSENDAIIIRPFLADQQGRRIPTGSSSAGKPSYRQKTLVIDGEQMDNFMDEVTGDMKFTVTKNGQPLGSYSWEGGCEAFMKEVFGLLQSKNWPCGAVVLTGGASKMPFIDAIAKRIFEDTAIYIEDVPSITVARGLCVIGKTDKEVVRIAEQLTERTVANTKAKLREIVIESGARELAEKAFQAALSTLSSIHGNITVRELQARIEAQVSTDLNQQVVDAIMLSKVQDWQNECLDNITTDVNEGIRYLYSGMLPSNTIVLQTDDIRSAMQRVTINGGSLTVSNLDFGENIRKIIANITGAIIGLISYVITAILIVSIPFLGALLVGVAGGAIAALVKDFIENDPDRIIKEKHILNAIKDFQNNEDQKIKTFQNEFVEQISANLDPEQLTSGLPETIRNALDIAALKQFKIVDN